MMCSIENMGGGHLDKIKALPTGKKYVCVCVGGIGVMHVCASMSSRRGKQQGLP